MLRTNFYLYTSMNQVCLYTEGKQDKLFLSAVSGVGGPQPGFIPIRIETKAVIWT